MTEIRRSLLVLLLGLMALPPVMAQAFIGCGPGDAEAYLDINDVRARLLNGGHLFFRNRTTDEPGYLVPKEGGNSPIFAANLWVGGKVGGELRVSAAQYGAEDPEFWPGPLDNKGTPSDNCLAFDRIYRVSRGDVARYVETGEMTEDLRDWPVEIGAPVLDGDGIEGNYNLAGGDEPAISGEQMAWWVMNDAATTYRNTTPLPVEVQVSAFAVPSTVQSLHQATFYRYRIRYAGEAPLDSAFIAFWTDVDLGDAADDYVGTDTTLDLSFAYNSNESDRIYGTSPPAVGAKLLQGPIGIPNNRDDDEDGVIDEIDERLGLTSSSCYFDAPGSPGPAEAYFNCMKGRWFGGIPMTAFGFGYGTDGPVTQVAFPGDPVTGQFWSEENADGKGNPNFGGDRWYTVASGPFRLEPGESTEVVFAIPFAQGADRLDSVVKLRDAARFLRNAFDLGFFEPQRVGAIAEPPPLPDAFGLSRPFPNPFGASTSLTLTVPEDASTARLSVFDVLGREVIVLAEGVLPPGEQTFTLDGAGLPSGLYFIRLATARQTETLKVLHVE